MSRNRANRTIMMLICSCMVLLLIECSKIIPEEFDEKTYNIGSLANTACSYLSSDTTEASFLSVEAVRMDSLVDSTRLATKTHVQIIRESFSDLFSAVDEILLGELLFVAYPLEGSTTYIGYDHSLSGRGKVLFFISLELTEANQQSYIEVDLFDNEGNMLSKNSDIALETVSGCLDTLIYLTDEGVETGRETVPMIRGQFEFEVENQPYLIRLTNSDPENLVVNRMIILPQ